MVAVPAKLAALAFLLVVAAAGFGVCRWLVSVKVLVYVAGAPARESSVPSVGCGRPSVRPASRQVEHSKNWAVITTIFELNPAVMEVLDCWNGSRIVVVGDCKTNDTAWRAVESPRLVYLSPDDQALLPYKIAKHIPWNHFGRKSIGFMFAIHHGADLIYDFDDDNSVKCDSVFHQITDESQHLNVDLVRTNHYLHNPYMWFKPTNGQSQSELDVWPRGFPLAWINDVSTFMDNPSVVSQQINRSRIAVYQGLANHDPDVDAIYRMTRKLPVYFQKNTRVVRAVPLGTFSPWNAQAVLFQRNAFWGMMLPITVTGRVSDIWRSYITMCLMWKTGYHVAFTAPFVTQYRNPHLYMQDFYDERDLYDKADDLLGRLAAWQENASFGSLDEAFVDLIRNLTTGPTRFLDPADAALAEAWVADLGTAGYQWPPLVRNNVRVALKSPQVVDGRLDADHNLGQQGQEPPPAKPKGAMMPQECRHWIPARPPGVPAMTSPAMMPQRSSCETCVDRSSCEICVDGLPVMPGRILYLCQGPKLPKWLEKLVSWPSVAVIFLSFRDKSGEAATVNRTLFIPPGESTWTTGRNALYNESRKYQAFLGWAFEYLVFTDDDLAFHGDTAQVLLRLNNQVLRARPAVAALRRGAHPCETNSMTCQGEVDAMWNAFHATAAPLYLPYHTTYDNYSWHMSQAIMIRVLQLTASAHVATFPGFDTNMKSNVHGKYPRGKPGMNVNWGEVKKYLGSARSGTSSCFQASSAPVPSPYKRPRNLACTCASHENASPSVDYRLIIKCHPFHE